MSWVRGLLEGCISPRGDIAASFDMMEVVDGPRPKTAGDIGADPQQLQMILDRPPGAKFATPARLGIATALRVGGIDLRWGEYRERIVGFIESRNDVPWTTGCLVGMFCDFGAPSQYGKMDICGGVAESTDILASAYHEVAEIGFYNEAGWGKYVLAPEIARFQNVVTAAQEEEWGRLAPDIGPGLEIPLGHSIYDRGMEPDQINGEEVILAAEPENGSIEVIRVAFANLPRANGGWVFRDTEHRPDGQGGWLPLNRRPQVIGYRRDVSYKYTFGPEGFDPSADVIALTGFDLEKYLNEKTRVVLEQFPHIP